MFPDSYEQSRARFRHDLALVQRLWPNARLRNHPVGGDENLTIDWIEAEPPANQSNLLMFTTGEHGIEGYVGSAMLQVFIEEYLGRLDPQNTGVLLVHAVNPWGMRHRRRTNAANVDLNRTFLWTADEFDPSFNPDCARLASLLIPQGMIRNLAWSGLRFAVNLLVSMIALGPHKLRRAALLGQYRFPQGIYYGGQTWPEETRTLVELYRAHISKYAHIVHLDMHTGYGPRYQMSLVNSYLEPTDSAEFIRRFAYPWVVKSNPAEFYSIRGDMIDFVYTLVSNEFPGRRLYSTSFEFGTYGSSTAAVLNSLRAKILENQLRWFGVSSQAVRERVEHDFRELFFPTEARWREQALANARRAFEGILRAQDLFVR
jgi:hypothetical protein